MCGAVLSGERMEELEAGEQLPEHLASPLRVCTTPAPPLFSLPQPASACIVFISPTLRDLYGVEVKCCGRGFCVFLFAYSGIVACALFRRRWTFRSERIARREG